MANENFDIDNIEPVENLDFLDDDFDYSQFPDPTEEELEKFKFYDCITENTQNAMKEMDSIFYLLDHCEAYNFDKESTEIKTIRKNVEQIFDRLGDVFDDYDNKTANK